MAFNGKYTDAEVNIWKELSNKIAWAIGTTLGVRYSDASHDARAQALRKRARISATAVLTAAETAGYWKSLE